MSPEEKAEYIKKRKEVREVLHNIVTENGGVMGKTALLDEGERCTGADRKMVYSALRTSELLHFNRHHVAFARSHKELMERLGYKEVVDQVIEGPGLMTTHYVHYEKA